ncbi:MAG TPA: HRDC domain-containing protein, partial [Caldilinea sp.]|nr:HRDC domain-containing protein [Caldilinea sp.]
RDVDADIVLPNSTLLAIAQSNPATLDDLAHLAELTPWKLAAYSAQILDVLAQTNALQPTL